MRHVRSALACAAVLLSSGTAVAQTDPNLAMNKPDQVAWQLFIQVNGRAGGTNSVFETFASDTDTFQQNPQYPTTAVPSVMRPPLLETVARETALKNGVLLPAVPPDPTSKSEETRRNKAAFDFIFQNGLYKISGLRAAFGKTLSFPVDAIEVKANWVPVESIPLFTKNQVSAAQVAQLYHVNTGSDGKKYALVSMHVISKLVPNWTWATFEHRFNPGRCDIIGCRDSFGAQAPVVVPLPTRGQTYPDCVKSPALTALLAQATIEPAYVNYCLKGSQADFIDNTGLDTRLGNSVTEDGFVSSSSCMSCHGRAAFDRTGSATSPAGFVNVNVNPPIGPLGPLLPTWYWSFTGQPPIFEGMNGLTRNGTSVDFVWSIPQCAIDDTQTPPAKSPCIGQ
jgi:hypothetical protein